MDFPTGLLTNEVPGYLTTANSPIAEANLCANTAFNAAAAWPVANKAFYVPVLVDRIVTVKKMAVINGATLNGNVDVGIYDEAKTKIVSIGTGVAQAGTSAVQTFDITDTTLLPGLYYLAMATNSSTATYFRANGAGAEQLRACGMQEQTTAYALPATATFGAMVTSFAPLVMAQYTSAVL